MHPLAGKPAPREILVHVPRLIAAYYTLEPDPAEPSHRVAFGTSGHRGSSLRQSFNEAHIVAIAQALCELRAAEGTTGPCYVGIDTHALSDPAFLLARALIQPADFAFCTAAVSSGTALNRSAVRK